MIRKSRPIPGLSLISRDLVSVEKLLREETRSDVRLVMEVCHHILGSGGKRFRPALTLLSGRLAGLTRKKELLSYATAIEYAHTSSLLHDDVIDEAELRRGRKSANRLFGNAPSIIVGDYLLFKSFALMRTGQNLKVINFMTGIAVDMAEGEAYQLTQKSRVDLSEKEYERIIRAKTALLIQAACQIPAIAAGAPKRREKALAGFAYHLGLAFQISDDVLDYAATDQKWGKQVGKDFLEGKTTLPLIIAYHRAGRAEQELIRRLFKKPARTQADCRRLVKIMRQTDALAAAAGRGRDHVAIAKKHLAAFPDNPAKKALLELADYVMSRTV
ncbi:MAG TPA: polyprenyl synthetase family protein [bacterium]|nr:polyprenyl synthetase family protein [bacterium]